MLPLQGDSGCGLFIGSMISTQGWWCMLSGFVRIFMRLSFRYWDKTKGLPGHDCRLSVGGTGNAGIICPHQHPQLLQKDVIICVSQKTLKGLQVFFQVSQILGRGNHQIR